MFVDNDLSLDELIEYYIKMYEKENNNDTKLVILEKLNQLYKEQDNNDSI